MKWNLETKAVDTAVSVKKYNLTYMTSVVFSYLTSESVALLDFYVMYLFNDETLVTKQLSYKAVVLSDFNT